MEGLRLKLKESVNNILLEKEGEILLRFENGYFPQGRSVVNIVTTNPVPFEVVTGTVTIYATSGNSFDPAGKTELTTTIPSGQILVLFSAGAKVRLLPTLSSNLTEITSTDPAFDNASLLYIDSFEDMPYSQKNTYFIAPNQSAPKDIDMSSLISEDGVVVLVNRRVPDCNPYLKGSFTTAMRAIVESSMAKFQYGYPFDFSFIRPISGVLNIELGAIPHTAWNLYSTDNTLSAGVVNYTFNENYGGNNWFARPVKYTNGWRLILIDTVVPTAIVDKIIIELARSVGGDTPADFRLHGVRSSASDAAWATISSAWGLTTGGVFV